MTELGRERKYDFIAICFWSDCGKFSKRVHRALAAREIGGRAEIALRPLPENDPLV
jgi:hypothetical protein